MNGSHVVLGGNGVVGRETAAALLAAGLPVASVSRGPSRTAGVESITADLRDDVAALQALEGAEVAYLMTGLPYRTRVWRSDWPTIMRNVIDASIASGTHLVFFDNVYVYGKVDGPMTESTPIRPNSVKGEIRADLLRMLGAARSRELGFTVARSADFYGPGASTSVFNGLAIDRVVAGKAPTWLLDATLPHSMTYTPDIGRALAIIGTDARARGRTWHLPTAPALTGQEYLAIASGGTLGTKTMSLAAMRLGSIFITAAREALEMSYQNTEPYVFDSSLFESTFDVAPTPYEKGIARTLEVARSPA